MMRELLLATGMHYLVSSSGITHIRPSGVQLTLGLTVDKAFFKSASRSVFQGCLSGWSRKGHHNRALPPGMLPPVHLGLPEGGCGEWCSESTSK